MNINEQPTYYAIIPANVRYDNKLKANEKLLFGEITCLTQSTGFCFASNEYFANLYGTTKETVSRWVSNLERQGYLKTMLEYRTGTKQVIKRYIQINQYPIDENINTPIDENINTPIDENINTPIDENIKDNNTSINNTSINNKKSTKQSDYQLFIDYLKNNVSIPSKVTSTRQGKELFNNIADKKQLCIDYINHQEEKAEFSKRITAFMEDYEKSNKSVVDISEDLSRHRFTNQQAFNKFNSDNGNRFELVGDGYIRIKQ